MRVTINHLEPYKECEVDFKRHYELIDELLVLHGLEITDDMSRDEQEEMDIKRQNFVLQRRINACSIEDLETLVQTIKASQS